MAAMHPFQRLELLVGSEGYARLQSARIAVIGLGGVGSYAAEALARSGVGTIGLVDFDRVCVTNLNRQLHATRKTVNQPKADLMAERVASINPKATVIAIPKFFGADSADEILGTDRWDVVLDCIDNMTSKVLLLEQCVRRNIRVISALGAGGRMDPTRIQVSDLIDTNIDPFARLVRDLLRQRGIERGIECVWSDEPPNDLDATAKAAFKCICPDRSELEVNHCETRFQIQGSNAWMPAIYGLTMAGVAVNRLLERQIRGPAPAIKPPRDAPSRIKPSRQRKRELLAGVGLDRPDST